MRIARTWLSKNSRRRNRHEENINYVCARGFTGSCWFAAKCSPGSRQQFCPCRGHHCPGCGEVEPACTWNPDFRTCRGFQQARSLHGATEVCRWRSRGSPLASRGRECNRGAGHVAGGHGREVRHGQHARVPHRFVSADAKGNAALRGRAWRDYRATARQWAFCN